VSFANTAEKKFKENNQNYLYICFSIRVQGANAPCCLYEKRRGFMPRRSYTAFSVLLKN